MSEKVEKTTEPVETGAEKPAGKVKAKATAKQPEEKKNFLQRGWAWVKKNRKPIFACAGSFVAGAGATVAGGMLMNRRAERRAQQCTVSAPTEPTEPSLDPNI